MPEFELPIGGAAAWEWYFSRDEVVQGYVEAMFFTECHSDNPELEDATVADLSNEARERICKDCMAFQATPAFKAAYDADYDREEMGRDLWYTRNGHGCGFWDGDYTEPHETALDAVAKAMGEVSLYKGDDGKLYLT